MAQETTEVGFNVMTYTAGKLAGTIGLMKSPAKASAGYIITQTTFSLQPSADGSAPKVVEGAPVFHNINRASLETLEAKLVEQEAEIAATRKELAAIAADMDALDAAA